MKHMVKILAVLLLLLALAGCSSFFAGTRDSGRNWLELEYRDLNTHDEEIFKVKQGDVIVGDIVNEKGTLRVTIKHVGGDAVYEDEDADTGHIEVEAQESGSYWVQVSGDHARGSAKFSVREAPRQEAR